MDSTRNDIQFGRVALSEHMYDPYETPIGEPTIGREVPALSASGESASAFRLGNLSSLPNAGKWRGQAFAGMVVRRAMLEQPGVELSRLLKLEAIFPATLEDLASYERTYGEPSQVVESRRREFIELRQDLGKRIRASRRASAKVKLLEELIREWSAIESRCRTHWWGESGILIGKSEE